MHTRATRSTTGRRRWVALGAVYACWGSVFLANSVMLGSLPPLLTSGARFALAGAVLLAVLAVRDGRGSLRLDRRQAWSVLVVAAVLIPGATALTVVGQSSLPSGLVALIGSLGPVWTVLLRVGHRERPSAATVLAVLLGLAGMALLTLTGDTTGEVRAAGLLVVLASLLWAAGSFYAPRLDLPASLFVTAGYQMLLGGLLAVAAGAVLGETSGLELGAVPPAAWLAVGWLALGGSLIGYTAFAYLVGTAPPSVVATTGYVTPVIAVALGAGVLGETVGVTTLLGGAAALASCGLILGSDARSARPSAASRAGLRPGGAALSRMVPARAPAEVMPAAPLPTAAGCAPLRVRPRPTRARAAVVAWAGRDQTGSAGRPRRRRALRPPGRR